jgi:hypothetical protein
MKKMMVVLAMMLTVSSITAFAGDGDVSTKVLNAFQQDFSDAADVKWTEGDDYYKASFLFKNQYVSAYYSPEGELYGITRYISSLDLPLNLLLSLKKDYSKFWITDLFELSKKEGTSYYITLEDADTKIILKASGSNEWTNYKKIKKT